MATVDALLPAVQATRTKPRGAILRALWADKVAFVCVVYLVALVTAAIFAPLLAPSDPTAVELSRRLTPPVWLHGGTHDRLLGADALGRDVLSRLFFGARVSVGVAAAVVLTAGTVGTLLGLYAGYRGGWRDSLIMRTVDAQLAFPGLLLVIAVVTALGPSVPVIVLVLAIYGWMIYARLVRSSVLQLRQELFVTAAELSGVRGVRIATRHLLPNLAPALITQAMLELARVILVESSLSYLGLGIQPPNASWGLMVAENQAYLSTGWWTVLFPGLAIAISVLALNQVANWLRATADPTTVTTVRPARPRKTAARTAAAAETAEGAEALLSVSDLSIEFVVNDVPAPVVQNVSIAIAPGQFMGLVGESGSGKTVTAMSILDLIPAPGQRVGGSIRWKGRELSNRDIARLRGRGITMVFQDPMTSLNALVSVGAQITEVLRKHRKMSRAAARVEAMSLLAKVGIAEPARTMRQLPSALSGGMRQRIMIAIALAPQPDLIIADEPTTALDVTIQAQILELLQALQRDLGVAVLLITHDLGVVAGVCDSVTVMYGGRVVERGPVLEVFGTPTHPYTAGLLAATPRADRLVAELTPIPGSPPTAVSLASGCAFAPRCGRASAVCAERPELVALTPTRASACWFAEAVPTRPRSHR